MGRRSAGLSRSASERLFDGLLNPSSKFYLTPLRLIGKEALCIRSRRTLNGSFLFNTGHSGLELQDYSLRLRWRGVKPICMVHDLIPVTNPEYCRAGERDKHIVRMNNVLLSSGVIANSQATLDELRCFADKAGLPLPPAVVSHLAPARASPPSSKRPIASPYFRRSRHHRTSKKSSDAIAGMA